MTRFNRRVESHGAIERGAALTVQVDGETIAAYAGETLAAAMLAAGRRTLRASPRTGGPRGVFCGMGVCYDCLMVIDGRPNVRSCMTYVAEGMQAQTQRGPGEDAEPIPASD